MAEIPEKLIGNQWLNIAFASLILIAISIINPIMGAKYINLFFLTFVYGLVSFFVNSFFRKVVYKGKPEDWKRGWEYFLLFLILIFYFFLAFPNL